LLLLISATVQKLQQCMYGRSNLITPPLPVARVRFPNFVAAKGLIHKSKFCVGCSVQTNENFYHFLPELHEVVVYTLETLIP